MIFSLLQPLVLLALSVPALSLALPPSTSPLSPPSALALTPRALTFRFPTSTLLTSSTFTRLPDTRLTSPDFIAAPNKAYIFGVEADSTIRAIFGFIKMPGPNQRWEMLGLARVDDVKGWMYHLPPAGSTVHYVVTFWVPGVSGDIGLWEHDDAT